MQITELSEAFQEHLDAFPSEEIRDSVWFIHTPDVDIEFDENTGEVVATRGVIPPEHIIND